MRLEEAQVHILCGYQPTGKHELSKKIHKLPLIYYCKVGGIRVLLSHALMLMEVMKHEDHATPILLPHARNPPHALAPVPSNVQGM